MYIYFVHILSEIGECVSPASINTKIYELVSKNDY